MADDERTDETSDQAPDEQAPQEEAPEAPAEGGAEETPAEEQTSATEETPGGETPATGDDGNAGEESQTAGAPDQDQAEDQPEEQSQAPAAERPADAESSGEEKPKAKDQPPGAELEPIAIEPERELSAEERARREAEEEERAKREAEATAESPDEEAPRKAAVKLEGDARVIATGKRKSSIARVIILPGDGKVMVNKRELDAYFPRSLHQSMARQPLVATGYDGNVDVQVRVHGGGISGQAGAVRHGIARALVEVDPELRGELKRRGYLTRDAREKERRKAGLKKARKRPQFSKR
jgi:small subunit ribosomal protein S9